VRRALERFGGVRALAALIAAVAVALLLRYPGHLSAEASITEHDWFALHRFDLAQMQRAWSQGRIVPQWTPAVLGGTPLFAVPTKPFSYPPLWLATRLLGPDLAMNVLLFAHAAFGALGTALLARRLGQRGLGPIACALLFVLARAPAHTLPATPFSYGYAVALWPWFLIAWTDLLEGPRRVRAAVWVAVWGAAQWHTGGEPALYWLAAFVALYSLPWLARADVSLRAVAGPALLAALVLGGLAAPKLLPELAWLEHSGRGRPLDVEFLRDSALEEQHAARGGGSRLWTLARLAFEFADGGGRWVLIAGALLGLAASRSRRAWLALALGAAAGFVLASGALHELAWEWLPGYDRMRRHTRFVNAGFFGLIVMAGFGLQARPWAAATRRARALGWGALALGAALLLWDTGALPGVRWRHARLHSARERLELTAPYYAAALADPGRFRIHHEENREQGVWSALGLESTSGLLGGPASRHPRLIELLPERASCGELEGDARGALDVLGVRYSACYQPLDAPRVEDVSLAGPARESADARLAGTRISVCTGAQVFARAPARSRRRRWWWARPRRAGSGSRAGCPPPTTTRRGRSGSSPRRPTRSRSRARSSRAWAPCSSWARTRARPACDAGRRARTARSRPTPRERCGARAKRAQRVRQRWRTLARAPTWTRSSWTSRASTRASCCWRSCSRCSPAGRPRSTAARCPWSAATGSRRSCDCPRALAACAWSTARPARVGVWRSGSPRC
jgi:hypothetical protein